MKKVSNWWYLFPIIFNIVGGLIAWILNRKEDPKKARNFIIVGIIFLVTNIVIIVGVASIVVKSLDEARDVAQTTSVMSMISQLRSMAEIEGAKEMSYANFNCSHGDALDACESIEIIIGEKPTIITSDNEYCIFTKLTENSYYCADARFNMATTNIFPGGDGYCDGINFACPVETTN